MSVFSGVESLPVMDNGVDVLLVVMPYHDPNLPALGVSLLKSELESRGIKARVLYSNLRFADLIGLDLYSHLCGSELLGRVVGEWVFAKQAFGAGAADKAEIADHIRTDWSHRTALRVEDDDGVLEQERQYLEEVLIPQVLALSDSCGEFLEAAVGEMLLAEPTIVGFTLVMGQTAPALAAAKALKEKASDSSVFFGGPGCHGSMGEQLLRSFPWVDYVCVGEGDQVFADYVSRLLEDRGAAPPQGIVSLGSGADAVPHVVQDLDSIAEPEYSDYFEQRQRARIATQLNVPSVMMETSRGCWWGEHSQCRFCGLNGLHVGYRSKSHQRIVSEMKRLVDRTGVRKIQLTDNILDTRRSGALFSSLAWKLPGVEVHCETSANLTVEKLKQLGRGGVRHIQPGIESLSDPILRLMRKGTSLIQNVMVLRSAEELGMRVSWFFLWGIPGEPPEEYERMSNIVPLLAHLPAPVACRQITLQRFSPYFENPGHYGFRSIQPSDPYSLVFPLKDDEIANLSSCFSYEYADNRDPREYTRSFRKAVVAWQAGWRADPEHRPRLDALVVGDRLVVRDGRPCAVRSTHRLPRLPADILLLCRKPQAERAIAERLAGDVSVSEVESVLGNLAESKLVLEHNGRFLSLPVFGKLV